MLHRCRRAPRGARERGSRVDASTDQQEGGGQRAAARLAGCFCGSVWGIDCLLTLRLNAAGVLTGVLEADGEPLDVALGPPGPDGALSGVVRARNLPEPFATFHARLTADGLRLEADVTASGSDPGPPARVTLTRLWAGPDGP